ncbi:MAG TPA: hypothetical protein VEW92_03160 [Nitrososphaeraceae archaeon]|jgi:hypothetical protein|nr:hypothetical protein [Nitrososphaeraceae archaeon]
MEGKSYVLRQKEIEFDPRPKVCARLEHILKNRQEYSSIPILQL